MAALETRRRKDYRVTPELLAPEWQARAAALGHARERVSELLGRVETRRLSTDVEVAIVALLGGADGLTKRKSTFTRRDVIQGVCDALPPGVVATVEDLEAVADRFLQSDRAVVLAVGQAGMSRSSVLCRRDGKLVPIVPDERM